MPFSNRKKNMLEDLFKLELSQCKKYHPSGNLEFNYLGIVQSLKVRLIMEKILPISLKLKLTPNTLGGDRLLHVGSRTTPQHKIIWVMFGPDSLGYLHNQTQGRKLQILKF